MKTHYFETDPRISDLNKWMFTHGSPVEEVHVVGAPLAVREQRRLGLHRHLQPSWAQHVCLKRFVLAQLTRWFGVICCWAGVGELPLPGFGLVSADNILALY